MNIAPAIYARSMPTKLVVAPTTPSLCRRTPDADIRHSIHHYLRNAVLAAPCSGIMTAVFETGHAYGITRADGSELLIHIGLDTEELAGKGFSPKVKQGQEVVRGQIICEVDLEYLKSAGMRTDTMLLFPELTGRQMEFEEYGKVERGKTVVARIGGRGI